MADPTPPPGPGEIRLYDAMTPPLAPGRYRVTADVGVTLDGDDTHLASARELEVDGPRFALDPGEVAAVFPPRGGTGGYAEALPQIVLHRRTLPWERPVVPGTPGLMLLVLTESEYTLLERMPLEQVVPADALGRMGNPAGVTCDAVELADGLLSQLAPSRDELALLAHVRRVNVADRADAGAEDDGWYAVVMANRLPVPGVRNDVFLVSVEQRTDVVPVDPPADLPPGSVTLPFEILTGGVFTQVVDGFDVPSLIPPGKKRLVVLHRWSFAVTVGGTFRERMRALDVGLMGDVRGESTVTDTGHLPVVLRDRAGEAQQAWYRGPLVPFELTRDSAGPYHSADQCRRVSPETGLEDLSYASAFEVGRLLAISDARLAQELMRWRRTSYTANVQKTGLADLSQVLMLSEPLTAELDRAPASTLAVAAISHLAESVVRADATGLRILEKRVPGLDPERLAKAWSLPDAGRAEAILKGTELVVTIEEKR